MYTHRMLFYVKITKISMIMSHNRSATKQGNNRVEKPVQNFGGCMTNFFQLRRLVGLTGRLRLAIKIFNMFKIS